MNNCTRLVYLWLLALALPWCTSRASWRQGRSWWVRLWKRRALAPGWCRCSLQAPRWSGGPGWGDHHHHHHQDDHNRHHRHRRQYHHHLVARHVVMHQVRGIGMMQYITKMMKTKYLGGVSVMIQMIQKQWFSIKCKACFLGVCIIWLLWRNDDGKTKPWRPCTSDYYCTSSYYYIIRLYYHNYYHYHYYQTMASMYICSRASWTLASIV